MVVDLGSAHGTWVDGQQLPKVRLRVQTFVQEDLGFRDGPQLPKVRLRAKSSLHKEGECLRVASTV